MKIYFASPLFSNMERIYNADVVSRIRNQYPDIEVYLPQEQGDINDKSSYADSVMIAKLDTQELLSSDLLIAVLDGITVDAGVASEIGVAYQAGIPVLGLYTDSRQEGYDNKEKIEALSELAESQFSYVNLYTVGLIKLNGYLTNSEEDLINRIVDYK
ncbi:nucleoside 2-deoxyribosyltransferase [Erysipelothrix sp. HDW6A]|uniref:nucleoside 2-deoxyribosyltransferase n=1 Tax=Erysipelothrix sp. HDW6A TaxID=2714928 RepID=UPI00140B5E3E|nr:nucleoside 2-deoxyribosyltransferase [Erysipelothrix sp. HDW6A]QIK57262.1 nucleoside 2-deoxyribosyltransferase [Erysipelothrix sp. HDW6A]